MNEADFPEGWAAVPLSAVTERVQNVDPAHEPTRRLRYIDISAIDNSRFEVVPDQVKEFLGKDAPSRARRPVQSGDVLFSNVRTYLRNIALVSGRAPADLCSTGFTVLRPNRAVLPEYLLRWVLTDAFIDRVTPQQTGAHYPATSDRVVLSELIALPPIAEQRRIVEKVEALLACVNAARDRLAKVPAILRRFRQSVLGAACSGGLTEDWRERTRPVRPSLEETGLTDDLPGLPYLPEGWSTVPMVAVVERFQYGTSDKADG